MLKEWKSKRPLHLRYPLEGDSCIITVLMQLM